MDERSRPCSARQIIDSLGNGDYLQQKKKTHFLKKRLVHVPAKSDLVFQISNRSTIKCNNQKCKVIEPQMPRDNSHTLVLSNPASMPTWDTHRTPYGSHLITMDMLAGNIKTRLDRNVQRFCTTFPKSKSLTLKTSTKTKLFPVVQYSYKRTEEVISQETMNSTFAKFLDI